METLEKKQLDNDTKLYVINRYWNSLNEDMRLILQRFDVDQLTNSNNTNDHANEDSNESNSSPTVNEETNSFVRQLANCDKEELDDIMRQRVLLSTRAVSKVNYSVCFGFSMLLFFHFYSFPGNYCFRPYNATPRKALSRTKG